MFKGFPTVQCETHEVLYHLYCRINPQFLSIIPNLQFKNFSFFFQCDQFLGLFLKPLNLSPEYFSKATVISTYYKEMIISFKSYN